MPSVLPLRDRIDHWIESQIGDELPVPNNPEFRRNLQVHYEIQRSTRLPFSEGHMQLAAAEGVTDDNLPSVLRRVLHKPRKVWMEGDNVEMAVHLGSLSGPEQYVSPTMLVRVHANVLDVHLAEFTIVYAGNGWISVAEKPLVADVRGDEMRLSGDFDNLIKATAMLSIVPTVPA